MNKKTIEQYKLTTKDWFSHKQGWTIITRTGIEKIQAAENIRVRYQVEKMEQDWCVIKAIGCRGNDPKGDYLGNTPFVETYGSAKKGGFKEGTTQSWYLAEIAEKRSLSRCVLKLTGLYQQGVFGEDESDEFEDERSQLTSEVINRANNAILRGEKTADEVIESLEASNYLVGETHRYHWKNLKVNKGQEVCL